MIFYLLLTGDCEDKTDFVHFKYEWGKDRCLFFFTQMLITVLFIIVNKVVQVSVNRLMVKQTVLHLNHIYSNVIEKIIAQIQTWWQIISPSTGKYVTYFNIFKWRETNQKETLSILKWVRESSGEKPDTPRWLMSKTLQPNVI